MPTSSRLYQTEGGCTDPARKVCSRPEGRRSLAWADAIERAPYEYRMTLFPDPAGAAYAQAAGPSFVSLSSFSALTSKDESQAVLSINGQHSGGFLSFRLDLQQDGVTWTGQVRTSVIAGGPGSSRSGSATLVTSGDPGASAEGSWTLDPSDTDLMRPTFAPAPPVPVQTFAIERNPASS